MMLGPPTQQTLVPLMVNMVNPRANIGATQFALLEQKFEH